MRSNIARTRCSGSAPDGGPLVVMRRRVALGLLAALELRQEGDHVVELLGVLLLERGEGRHGRGRVDQRARDGLARDAAGDLGQLRPRTVVAVLADLVTRQAARLRDDLLAGVEL